MFYWWYEDREGQGAGSDPNVLIPVLHHGSIASGVDKVTFIWRVVVDEGSDALMLTAGVRDWNGFVLYVLRSCVNKSGSTFFSTSLLVSIGCLMDVLWLSIWIVYQSFFSFFLFLHAPILVCY